MLEVKIGSLKCYLFYTEFYSWDLLIVRAVGDWEMFWRCHHHWPSYDRHCPEAELLPLDLQLVRERPAIINNTEIEMILCRYYNIFISIRKFNGTLYVSWLKGKYDVHLLSILGHEWIKNFFIQIIFRVCFIYFWNFEVQDIFFPEKGPIVHEKKFLHPQ